MSRTGPDPPATQPDGGGPRAAGVRVLLPWPADGDGDRLGHYLASLRAAGAVPLVIAPGAPVETSGALLLPGGGDVDPALYGQARDPRTSVVAAALDNLELELARRALARGTPVLAVCRGLQVLNVAAGGDLVQHVEGHMGVRHAVRASGMLAWLDGAEVNSSHHQAVGRLADGFAVLARAPDGVVEAVHSPDHPFALGVQWHPEREPRHPRLFEALVAAARPRGPGGA